MTVVRWSCEHRLPGVGYGFCRVAPPPLSPLLPSCPLQALGFAYEGLHMLFFLYTVTVSVFISWGSHDEVPQTGWLTQQQCVFSWFSRSSEGWKCWRQGVGRTGFLGGLSAWLADGCLPLSSRGPPFVFPRPNLFLFFFFFSESRFLYWGTCWSLDRNRQ